MKYNVKGQGGKYWVQQRAMFWWVDVYHQDRLTGRMFRKEFTTLSEAVEAAVLYRLQDREARRWWKRRATV